MCEIMMYALLSIVVLLINGMSTKNMLIKLKNDYDGARGRSFST